MKRLLLLILFCLSFPSLGQELAINHRPFSILIIAPDSATIDSSLEVFADSIETRYVKEYYDFLNAYEVTKDIGTDDQKEMNALRIQRMKLREMEVWDYKYYDEVVNKIYKRLDESFNMVRKGSTYWHRENVMDGDLIRITELFTYDFKKLSTYHKVDYILRIENIHTINYGGSPESISLGLTAMLYSAKIDKVVFHKEIVGNSLLQDFEMRAKNEDATKEDTWSNLLESDDINCQDYLDCMVKSVVQFATRDIYKVLSKLQQ